MPDADTTADNAQLSHNAIFLARALREVRRRGVANSAHVAEAIGLSDKRANVFINALRDAKLVTVGELPKVGRRHAITLHGPAGCVVGVDMTLDQVTVVVGDLEYRVLNKPARARTSVPIDDWRGTLDRIAQLVERELAPWTDRYELVGVGLGLPGPVQRGTGSPESDHLLRGWKGVPIADELQRRLAAAGLGEPRVVVGNDASFGALGVVTRAVWGNPEKAPEDLVYVRVTQGIGMGLVIKGHLVTGANGFAGEIGHVRVRADGPICLRCERRGCLEVMASEKAVIDMLRGHAWHEGRRGPSTAADLLRATDARTHAEVGRAGWSLGFVLAAVANVLNPSWIVLGGAMTDMDAFRERFDRTLEKYALPQSVHQLTTRTWNRFYSGAFVQHRDRDVGAGLTPELLGAMAFVIDEVGDAFLGPRISAIQMNASVPVAGLSVNA